MKNFSNSFKKKKIITSRILTQLIWKNWFSALPRFFYLFLTPISLGAFFLNYSWKKFITNLSFVFAYKCLQISTTFIYLYLQTESKINLKSKLADQNKTHYPRDWTKQKSMKNVQQQQALVFKYFIKYFCAGDLITEDAQELLGALNASQSLTGTVPVGAQLLAKMDPGDT